MGFGGLLRRLSDGEFHSGEELGAEMAVSRAAVWKQLRKLEALGLELESVRGLGYRLPGGLELLDAERIRQSLGQEARPLLHTLDVLEQVGSTNEELLRRAATGDSLRGRVCTAEWQTAGRGRRGRRWISPFASSLYVSAGWEFSGGAASLEGLSLAVGTAVVAALCEHGVEGAALKWPNDVLVGERKLAGILIEMAGDVSGRCQVVVGVGINVRLPAAASADIDQPWIDAATAAGAAVSRNALLSSLLSRLLPLLERFEREGFAPFRELWASLDAYRDRPVRLQQGHELIAGVARGVDASGALVLETASGRQLFYGGEVSLRGIA